MKTINSKSVSWVMRRWSMVLLLTALGNMPLRSAAQFAPPPGSAQDTQSNGSNGGASSSGASTSGSSSAGSGSSSSFGLGSTGASDTGANEGDTDGSTTSTTGVVLSATQILQILQTRPEVVVELKSVIADQLQQQGTAIQADAITDEMLYSQIATSRAARASITLFLRARGFVSDEDLQRAALAGNDEDSQAVAGMEGTPLVPGLSLTGSTDEAKGNAGEEGAPSGAAQKEAIQNRRAQTAHNSTDEPQVLRQPAPYNLQSLRDLYTQIPSTPERLKRFGSEVFTRRSIVSTPTDSMARAVPGISAMGTTLTASAQPLDIPLGPDYVLGPGDALSINLWGGVTQTLTRVIDREGRVMLPEAGVLQVAGLTLEQAQGAIEGILQKQFRNAHVAVTVARLRTVRIYVVGDVQRPGAYDVSSLASPVSALYAAGGPTAAGSLRVMRHLRNDKVVGEVDLYDFLLHGVRKEDDRLEGGDTLLVPPAGAQVAVYGAVKRPAIYELRDEKTLAEVLDDAGGATVAAALGHITVERIDAHQQRETIGLNLPTGDPAQAQAAIAAFDVKDGDRVRVAPVLPYSERVIYLEGHVVRPGRMAYRDGMRLSDVLHSYQDLLPEPATQGEIVRLVEPDLHVETIDFDVPDALIGNTAVALQPFDTIRVFGRYERDAPNVMIRGEVLRPGSYALSEGMTAAQLVRMAGGFKRDALLSKADLISYEVVNGVKVVGARRDLQIGDAVLKEDREADAALKPGDVLTVHQLTGWEDIGASITIEGEVGHPGSYGFAQGEHLSDVLGRAGGFRETAYPEGAVLIRPEVRVLEEKSREELIRQIETSSAAARLAPSVGGSDQGATLQLIQQQQQQVLERLKSEPASGRLVIHIGANMGSWAGTAADIEVRSGDVLRIPKRPGFVLVTGQVYNAAAITFAPGRSAGWYLQRAGGTTQIANRKEVFIIRANGSVVGRRSGDWYDRDVLATRLDPGDVIVVPQKIIGASLVWRNLLATAQIAASIAITAAVAGL
ncbi:MAG: SLBB domain-containing protein [Terracidiphilus sp.]